MNYIVDVNSGDTLVQIVNVLGKANYMEVNGFDFLTDFSDLKSTEVKALMKSINQNILNSMI